MNEQRPQPRSDEFKLTGDDIMGKLKQILHEGNVRRIIVKNSQGSAIAEFPLTAGVVGALLAPPLAAVGAIAALVADATIYIERTEEPPTGTPPTQTP